MDEKIVGVIPIPYGQLFELTSCNRSDGKGGTYRDSSVTAVVGLAIDEDGEAWPVTRYGVSVDSIDDGELVPPEIVIEMWRKGKVGSMQIEWSEFDRWRDEITSHRLKIRDEWIENMERTHQCACGHWMNEHPGGDGPCNVCAAEATVLPSMCSGFRHPRDETIGGIFEED